MPKRFPRTLLAALAVIGLGLATVSSASAASSATTTRSSTTRHAPNVQVSLVLSGWHAKERLKFAGNYYSGCQKLKPNPCGVFRDYGPTEDSVGFVAARGAKFAFGYGWRTYKFPDNPSLASCTIETWYGGKTKVHNVTVCGHKHAVLFSVGASLYHS